MAGEAAETKTMTIRTQRLADAASTTDLIEAHEADRHAAMFRTADAQARLTEQASHDHLADLDFEDGGSVYTSGRDMNFCENSDQEWGWLVAREAATGIPAL